MYLFQSLSPINPNNLRLSHISSNHFYMQKKVFIITCISVCLFVQQESIVHEFVQISNSSTNKFTAKNRFTLLRQFCAHARTHSRTNLTNKFLWVLTHAQILMHKNYAQNSHTKFCLWVKLTHKYLYMITNSHTNKRTRVHVREYKLMYVSTNSHTNICTHIHMCL